MLAAALLLLAALAVGAGYFLGSALLRQTLGLGRSPAPGSRAPGNRAPAEGGAPANPGGRGGLPANPGSPGKTEPVEIPGTTLTLYRLELSGFADSAAAAREAERLTASGIAARPLPGGNRVILMYFETRRGAETYAAGLPSDLTPSVASEVLRPASVRLPGGAGADSTRQAVEALTQYVWDEARLWEEDFLGSTATAEDAVQRSRQLGQELATAEAAWKSAASATPAPPGLSGLASLLQLAQTNQKAVALWANGSPQRQTVVEAMSTFTQLVIDFQGWYRNLGPAGGTS
ncbi:MAG: hypothetical protein QJR08_08255 [Bacillota bacterium]|nr:hypothetical protein [Bacillota bacterium]